jgi:hypothetical protein
LKELQSVKVLLNRIRYKSGWSIQTHSPKDTSSILTRYFQLPDEEVRKSLLL